MTRTVLNRFIDDMERIKRIEGIDVQINNHPFIDDLIRPPTVAGQPG